MSIGDNIRRRRFELRMSQQNLADAMGYKTRSTIAKIESGENDVSHKKLLKFASVLETSAEALISGLSLSVSAVETYNSIDKIQHVVFILAGGKSVKNCQNIPNQFVSIHGKPVIVYCMQAYQAHPSITDIYVISLHGWESIIEAYAKQYGITKLRGIIQAGANGILSVKNGLEYIDGKYSDDSIILIQESTRPMVRVEIISKLLQACYEKGSATICQSMRDFVQFSISDGHSKYIDRNSIIDLQSPEAHKFSIVKKVFMDAKKQNHALTESCCTMLLYNLGYPINFIEGSINNIKLVHQEDIAVFSALLTEQ